MLLGFIKRYDYWPHKFPNSCKYLQFRLLICPTNAVAGENYETFSDRCESQKTGCVFKWKRQPFLSSH